MNSIFKEFKNLSVEKKMLLTACIMYYGNYYKLITAFKLEICYYNFLSE